MKRILTLTLFVAAMASFAGAQALSTMDLGLEGARKVAMAAEAEAKRLGSGSAIAVVDRGGNLLYVARIDGTFPAGSRVSIGKARTAAMFKKPTKFFEDLVNNGRTTMVALEEFTPLQGGVPIIVHGEVVGAIGVSGAASAQQDEEIAMVGATALGDHSVSRGTNGSEIFYLEKEEVAAAFVNGAPLVEVDDFKVHASHRNKGGEAEVHEHETDIIYVLEGGATFVTGGAVVNGRATAPGEIRGVQIDGGTTRRLQKGDVIIVPQGTPHWFKDVDQKVDYYVVKVLS